MKTGRVVDSRYSFPGHCFVGRFHRRYADCGKQNESSAYRPILLKLVLMKVKGKGFCNVFTYEDLVTNGVHPQESVVSVNGTLKLSYAVGKGKYILYDPQGQSGIFLSIE